MIEKIVLPTFAGTGDKEPIVIQTDLNKKREKKSRLETTNFFPTKLGMNMLLLLLLSQIAITRLSFISTLNHSFSSPHIHLEAKITPAIVHKENKIKFVKMTYLITSKFILTVTFVS